MKKKEKQLRVLGKELKTINDRIEFVRRELGYPVSSFARKLGGSKAAMINVLSSEKNEDPSLKTVKSMATVFPVSYDWLLVGIGNPYTTDDITPWKFTDRVDESPLDEEVNSRLKMIRENLELSQAMFADTLDVSRDVVSFMETNRTALTVPVLKRLIKKHKINPFWILFGEGNYLSKK